MLWGPKKLSGVFSTVLIKISHLSYVVFIHQHQWQLLSKLKEETKWQFGTTTNLRLVIPIVTGESNAAYSWTLLMSSPSYGHLYFRQIPLASRGSTALPFVNSTLCYINLLACEFSCSPPSRSCKVGQLLLGPLEWT